LVAAGARVLESGCGPCIGMGFAPAEGAVSLRTFNRNFAGRSGTPGDMVYLVSPATAVAAALTGEVTDPRDLTGLLGLPCPAVEAPKAFPIDDSMLQEPLPQAQAAGAEVIRGTTIVKPPRGEKLPDPLDGTVLIKVGDKVTTDHIMPAGALMKYRSNVPAYARYVFDRYNRPDGPTFAQRAQLVQAAGKAGVIVAGDSYGQGSSREHAALCPMYLGVRVVIAKAVERIHQANLVNFGILPLTFERPADYDRTEPADELSIRDVAAAVESADAVTVNNATRGYDFTCRVDLTPRQRKVLAAGGLLNYAPQDER
ncbi:MAG: aconitase family protein, partial [Phycisphaerae bacterium]